MMTNGERGVESRDNRPMLPAETIAVALSLRAELLWHAARTNFRPVMERGERVVSRITIDPAVYSEIFHIDSAVERVESADLSYVTEADARKSMTSRVSLITAGKALIEGKVYEKFKVWDLYEREAEESVVGTVYSSGDDVRTSRATQQLLARMNHERDLMIEDGVRLRQLQARLQGN